MQLKFALLTIFIVGTAQAETVTKCVSCIRPLRRTQPRSLLRIRASLRSAASTLTLF